MDQSETYSILIIEDDEHLAAGLTEYLEESYAVVSVPNAARAREEVMRNSFDVVLLDYCLPDEPGLSLFDEIKKRSPLTQVVVMTGLQDVDVPVQALRVGVEDFIFKPFSLTELSNRVEQLFGDRVSEREWSQARMGTSNPFPEMVGTSSSLNRIEELIGLVAPKEVTVLITGESGTGKELVARALHTSSNRSDRPFVAVNCAAIPESLLEDEMFGHMRGAFTDAKAPRKGKFEEADGGTLLLDEIGDMPLGLQAKLLRVLEAGEIPKLGTTRGVPVDVRVIAATNAELRERIEQREFRADLYYRLNVVRLHVPPLRERKEDIPLLVNHFLQEAGARYGAPEKQISPAGLRCLTEYDWPGNVRELRNTVEASVLFSGDRHVLEISDLLVEPEQRNQNRTLLPGEGIDLNRVLGEMERELILQSLERTGGNRKEAARLLSLKRTTLVAKLRRMGLLESA